MRAIIAKAVCRPLDPADLDARVEMFHLIFQGLGLRSIVNPQVDHRPLACLIEPDHRRDSGLSAKGVEPTVSSPG